MLFLPICILDDECSCSPFLARVTACSCSGIGVWRTRPRECPPNCRSTSNRLTSPKHTFTYSWRSRHNAKPTMADQRRSAPSSPQEPFRFMDLPKALRLEIWRIFCPPITDDGRVILYFVVGLFVPGAKISVQKTRLLRETTETTRTLLALHRETRRLVSRALPDVLIFGARTDVNMKRLARFRERIGLHVPLEQQACRANIKGMVRFRKERDAVHFIHDYNGLPDPTMYGLHRSFVESVTIVTINDITADCRAILFLARFKNLKRVIYYQNMSDRFTRITTSFNWEWFATKACVQELYFEDDGEMTVRCFSKPRVWPSVKDIGIAVSKEARQLVQLASTRGWEVVPIATFHGDKAVGEIHRLLLEQYSVRAAQKEGKNDVEGEEEDESEEDESEEEEEEGKSEDEEDEEDGSEEEAGWETCSSFDPNEG